MAYRKMSFGLSNAGATFQRAMDMALQGLINNFVLVYLDDITIFSWNVDEHFDHLRWIFERSRVWKFPWIQKIASLLFTKVNFWVILFLKMAFLLIHNILQPFWHYRSLLTRKVYKVFWIELTLLRDLFPTLQLYYSHLQPCWRKKFNSVGREKERTILSRLTRRLQQPLLLSTQILIRISYCTHLGEWIPSP